MDERRLVGIDLGITSAHTVRVLAGDGRLVCRRKAIPTLDSLEQVEQAALAETPAGTRLEVVVEPTGPAWLPIAVFFAARGHTVYRVSSAKAHDLRRVLSRHAKSNGIDADTLARLPLVDPAGLHPLQLPDAARAALDRRVRATDRLTQAAATHKRRIKDLVWQLLPASPLVGELGQADLAVLERWADPHALVAAGRARLQRLLGTASAGQHGAQRATQWLAAAHAALELDGDHPAIAWQELAAEVATEAGCCAPPRPNWTGTPASGRPATARSTRQPWPAACPAWPPSAAPPWSPPWAPPSGSPTPASSAASPAWPQGIRDRPDRPQGQPITKAGNRLLRTTLVRAADHARRQDPQLARIYWTQMVQRGKDHLGAVCVVAAHLAERAWTVMDRGTPYVICDIDGTPVTPAQAKAIIADHWTVPEQVRRRRRSKKGKAPQQVLQGHVTGARSATRRPSPSPASLGRRNALVKPTQPQP
jgi:transposase